jgi:phenolic acid decarboxylase
MMMRGNHRANLFFNQFFDWAKTEPEIMCCFKRVSLVLIQQQHQKWEQTKGGK